MKMLTILFYRQSTLLRISLLSQQWADNLCSRVWRVQLSKFNICQRVTSTCLQSISTASYWLLLTFSDLNSTHIVWFLKQVRILVSSWQQATSQWFSQPSHLMMLLPSQFNSWLRMISSLEQVSNSRAMSHKWWQSSETYRQRSSQAWTTSQESRKLHSRALTNLFIFSWLSAF